MKDTPEEIAKKEHEVEEYERRHPNGPPACIIRQANYRAEP